ncbi:carboxypeptidase regulatory-like domain-containing protein [Melittangium boletus]|uniref:Uncharacterized protein n=1 Tax=Melittangium boletus DSM 14713 TaxID=1294270 RepID=A0A250IAC1_9BACT|nr:carboxypeptidase regulatory-like domain-containing protein [Melittangium boletus]ATB28102.1 hypothetical protein MEBOL_001547 [Melittangium boletus DSM 14713]
MNGLARRWERLHHSSWGRHGASASLVLCGLMGVLSLASLGCADVPPAPPEESPAPPPPPLEGETTTPHSEPAGTSVLLQVIDTSGKPVPGAAISTQGVVVSLDGSGHHLFENLPPGRFFVRVDAPGFASATATVETQAGAHVGTQVTLLPLTDSITFEATEGGVLQTEQVHISLPPNAVVDALGQPVTGSVTLTVAALDPTRQLAAMPGPLEGFSSEAGATVQLESLFMAEVSLWSGGAPAQLAPGKTATLEFLLPESLASRYAEGELVPAWWFDLDAGQWREEGLGSIEASPTHPGRRAWVASVKHFTWWNADAPWTDKSCVDVLVVDNKGVPVKNVAVSAQGVSYTGASLTSFTTASGHACVELKRGGTAHLLAGPPSQPLSERVTVTARADAATCGGGACTPVQLVLPELICTPGASVVCAYSGPEGTENQGVCQTSRRWCDVSGTKWSDCEGEVLPVTEDCYTPFDDDCDGVVNEDCHCSDKQGQPCYGGPSGTEGVGICRAGTIECDLFGTVTCRGQRLPEADMCWTSADEDCDGANAACGTGHSGWTPTGSLISPEPRGRPVLLSTGKVLLIGSFIQVYNPATNTWRKLGSGPKFLYLLGALPLLNGKVLFVGEEEAKIYDPATNTWSATGPMGVKYMAPVAIVTLLADGKALVAGVSILTNNDCKNMLSQVYDPIANTWSSPVCMKYGHESSWSQITLLRRSGHILITTGWGRAELYDPATDSWSDSLIPSGFGAFPGHAATALPNGKVFITGGQGQDTAKHTAYEYDPSAITSAERAPMLAPRKYHTLISLEDGRILAMSGKVDQWRPPDVDTPPDSEIYDPTLDRWSPIAPTICPRPGHTATLLPNGKVLITGGCSDMTFTELYTP